MTNFIAQDLFQTIVDYVPIDHLYDLSRASPIFDPLICKTGIKIMYYDPKMGHGYVLGQDDRIINLLGKKYLCRLTGYDDVDVYYSYEKKWLSMGSSINDESNNFVNIRTARDQYGRYKKYVSVTWTIRAYGMPYIDFGRQCALLKSFDFDDWSLVSFETLYKYGSWTKTNK